MCVSVYVWLISILFLIHSLFLSWFILKNYELKYAMQIFILILLSRCLAYLIYDLIKLPSIKIKVQYAIGKLFMSYKYLRAWI